SGASFYPNRHFQLDQLLDGFRHECHASFANLGLAQHTNVHCLPRRWYLKIGTRNEECRVPWCEPTRKFAIVEASSSNDGEKWALSERVQYNISTLYVSKPLSAPTCRHFWTVPVTARLSPSGDKSRALQRCNLLTRARHTYNPHLCCGALV